MRRIFLDTNIYIIGQLKPLSPAEQLLKWLGYYTANNQSQIKVIISQELINQILRVARLNFIRYISSRFSNNYKIIENCFDSCLTISKSFKCHSLCTLNQNVLGGCDLGNDYIPPLI